MVAFPFRDLDDAIARVNDSMFGLQTGVFTNDLAGAWRAFGELEVGGVIINDVPTYRIDHMPYGGVKDSGLGSRGPALRDGRHDRDPDHGARPAGLSPVTTRGAAPGGGAAGSPAGAAGHRALDLRARDEGTSPSMPYVPWRPVPRQPFNGLHRGHRRLSIDSPVFPAWTRGTAWKRPERLERADVGAAS